MKEIVFVWSNTTYTGIIKSQEKHAIMGLKTVVKTSVPLEQEFTFYGRCDVGYCGPFNVLSITSQN